MVSIPENWEDVTSSSSVSSTVSHLYRHYKQKDGDWEIMLWLEVPESGKNYKVSEQEDCVIEFHKDGQIVGGESYHSIEELKRATEKKMKEIDDKS